MLNYQDTKLALIILEGIDLLLELDRDLQERTNSNLIASKLEENNCSSHLEALQSHQDQRVYIKASEIIDKFFETS
jgi:hypothetical protein